MLGERRTSDLLVIGGGVIGVSIAYQCARAGIDVVLVEQNELGAGTTSRTARVVRDYFPKRVHDSSLAVHSLADYCRFATDTGVDPGLRATGFLVVLTDQEQVADFENELPQQREAGVEVELLTSTQASERNPWLDPGGFEAAIWSPRSFVCEPEKIVCGYAERARAYGARLLTGTMVTDLDADGQVVTTAGDFGAQAVVIAAGPYSGYVAALAGLRVPVTGKPSELLLTEPIEGTDHIESPFTYHPVSGLKTRRLGSSFLVGVEDVPDHDSNRRDAWLSATAAELSRRFPRLGTPVLRTAWRGTLDLTPTRTAFIGRASGTHEQLFIAAGYSGRGLCHAAVTGRIIRDLYLGRRPCVDISPYAVAVPHSDHGDQQAPATSLA
jgi:sarcosine oxidase subunit beta